MPTTDSTDTTDEVLSPIDKTISELEALEYKAVNEIDFDPDSVLVYTGISIPIPLPKTVFIPIDPALLSTLGWYPGDILTGGDEYCNVLFIHRDLFNAYHEDTLDLATKHYLEMEIAIALRSYDADLMCPDTSWIHMAHDYPENCHLMMILYEVVIDKYCVSAISKVDLWCHHYARWLLFTHEDAEYDWHPTSEMVELYTAYTNIHMLLMYYLV